MIWLIATIIWILLMTSIALGCISSSIKEERPTSNTFWFGFWSGLLAMMAFGIFGDTLDRHNKPAAIDVYRGYTTLEITYKDSIPKDTVMVYKNK